MAKYVKFTVGGFFGGYKTVEIAIVDDTASYKILRNGLLSVDKKKSPAQKISAAWLKNLDALKIFEWEKNYFDEKVSDGEQWELIFRDGEKIYRGSGSNAWPENWEKFLDWLDELIPQLEFVNRRRLEKITMNYSSDEKIFETLTLDRREKTLTLDKKKSAHFYDLDEAIEKIFDACQIFFDGIDIADVEINFGTQINFELVRHDGSTETLEAPYSENLLPGLTIFIEELHACASDLTAEIFSPSLVEVALPKGKYILCKVQFKDSYKHYTYTTEDETLAIGDVVDVPVGRYNDVNQARIVEIGYFDEYEVPYPLDRIKKIIGKHIADNWSDV